MNKIKEIRQTLRSKGMTTQPIKTRPDYLRSYGLQPDVLIDVGVARGTAWLYRSFPAAKVVLIDPQPDCAAFVRERHADLEFDFFAAALGPAKGTASLNIPQKKTGPGIAMASIHRRTDELGAKFPHSEVREVDVRPLDEIAADYPGRVGLKIDTEGFEYEVLQGASETLKRCDFVILELSLTPRFDGVARPSDSMGLMAAAGLDLRDILSMASGVDETAKPRHVDALFTRWTN